MRRKMINSRFSILMLLCCFAWTVSGEGDTTVAYRATSDYTLQLSGQIVDGVEVFYSPRHVAYLVMSDQLDKPLIIRIPEEVVVEISATEVETNDVEGLASIMAAAQESIVSGFERRLKEIRFNLGETSAALVPAAPIVGWQSPQTLRAKNQVMRSGFMKSSAAMRTRAGVDQGESEMNTLVIPPHQEMLVEIFFGSWDDYSQLVMPGIMQLEEELSSSSIRFRYYGLPRRIADDPVGTERSIHGVPTMIVSVDGSELGRLVGRSLNEPLESLSRLLGGEPE